VAGRAAVTVNMTAPICQKIEASSPACTSIEFKTRPEGYP